MELAMVGLGKMGLNMATRLVRGGHRVVGFARTAATVQVAANIPNLSLLEVFPYWADHPGHVHFTDMAFEYQVKDGYLEVPQRPGLGIELIEDKVRPFLWAEIGPREARGL